MLIRFYLLEPSRKFPDVPLEQNTDSSFWSSFQCLPPVNWDIWNLFLQKCLLSSPLRFICLLSRSLNFICCQGDKKVNSIKKMLRNLLLRNHKMDEAATFHHVYDIITVTRYTTSFIELNVALILDAAGTASFIVNIIGALRGYRPGPTQTGDG